MGMREYKKNAIAPVDTVDVGRFPVGVPTLATVKKQIIKDYETKSGIGGCSLTVVTDRGVFSVTESNHSKYDAVSETVRGNLDWSEENNECIAILVVEVEKGANKNTKVYTSATLAGVKSVLEYANSKRATAGITDQTTTQTTTAPKSSKKPVVA